MDLHKATRKQLQDEIRRLRSQSTPGAAFEEQRAQLREQNELLHHKNLALKELMSQVGQQKERLGKAVRANLEQFVLPLVQKLGAEVEPRQQEMLRLVAETLSDVTSSFGIELRRNARPLSRREIEIADMIRKGLSSRKIAELLEISHRSVELHRYNIRKKLGLVGTSVNLAAHLRQDRNSPA